jgi:GxxExxY protein
MPRPKRTSPTLLASTGSREEKTEDAALCPLTRPPVQSQDARVAREPEEPEEPGARMDAVASAILHAAIEVHRVLGPGFLEAVYENALSIERTDRGIRFARQPTVPVVYKERLVGDMRPDLLVDGCLVVELKAVDHSAPIHLAQATSYLKAMGLPLALVIDFNVPVLLRGVRRVVRSVRTSV